MKVFGDTTSGNCLKVKIVADHLRLPYEWVTVSALSGETRTPQFLRLNPMGQIPVVELGDGRRLAQSNAIIAYLARGTALLPGDAWTRARIEEWLYWEQYSHEPYVAVCRFHMLYLKKSRAAREAWRVERGEQALDLMEAHLAGTSGGRDDPPRDYFVGERPTIADVSLLAYTRLAHEGGFDLAQRPRLRDWIARCELALGLPPAQA